MFYEFMRHRTDWCSALCPGAPAYWGCLDNLTPLPSDLDISITIFSFNM